MLKHLKNFKAVPRPLSRILHIQPKSEPALPIKKPYILHELNYKYKEGQEYNGFKCERVEYIPTFEMMSCTLRHKATGMEFWYLDRKDNNNVFSIHFRTPSPDSTGVAHIVEHLTLCGSQKFPIRDPFFKMLNRTVATNMNALTGPDFTGYPFSTRNEVDFRNVQQIYLDAVFKPDLLYMDFLQEAWRYEHKELHNRESEIMLKGIVYNEMIGVFADNARILRRGIVSNLMPNSTYKYVAGGDPLDIPNLSHSDLIQYHRKYYHPSNARMYCYGSFDLMKTLEHVDKEYLCDKSAIDNSFSRANPEPRWSEPRKLHISGRMDTVGAPIERQNQIAIALLLADRTNVQECFELNVLTELLIRGPNSAFYKSLIESSFSGGFNKCTGYALTVRDSYFILGMQDMKAEDFNKFTELYDQTVDKIVKDGFEPEHIESVLHKIELSLKHQTPDFGNNLLYNSMVLWNHEGDVVANTQISEMIAKLRYKLETNKGYFQEKMEKYFAKNPHKLITTMTPDEAYEEKFRMAEADMLKEKLIKFDKDKFDEIYHNGIQLEGIQAKKENTDILPCLSLTDVQQPIPWPKVIETTIQNVPTQLCKISSNEVTYLKCLFNVTGISEEDAKLVPLLCGVINDMGTANYDFHELDKLINLKTAGMDLQPRIVESIVDNKSYRLYLILTTHTLDKNVSDMFKLCQEVLLNFQLRNADRLKMLIENYICNLSKGIILNGHQHAMLSSAAMVTDAARFKCRLSGVDHIDFLRKYIQEHSTEEIQDKLNSIGSRLFSKSNMRVAINSSESFQPTVLEHYNEFLNNMPSLEQPNCNIDSNRELHFLGSGFQHHIMDTPLNYCAKSFFAVPYLHDDHPLLRIVAKLISAKYLLPVVRAQNGAYGTGARVSFDGVFHFYSYRDPCSTKTLEVFDKTYEWLCSISDTLDDKMLIEAKLGVIQLVDWPAAPGDVGLDNFVLGFSQDMYEKYRARVLSATVDDLRIVVDKYLKRQPKHVGKCYLGPAKQLSCNCQRVEKKVIE